MSLRFDCSGRHKISGDLGGFPWFPKIIFPLNRMLYELLSSELGKFPKFASECTSLCGTD